MRAKNKMQSTEEITNSEDILDSRDVIAPTAAKYFTATKALADLADYRSRKIAALIVATEGGGFQAIPEAYRRDISYTGSRASVSASTVRAAIKAELHA